MRSLSSLLPWKNKNDTIESLGIIFERKTKKKNQDNVYYKVSQLMVWHCQNSLLGYQDRTTLLQGDLSDSALDYNMQIRLPFGLDKKERLVHNEYRLSPNTSWMVKIIKGLQKKTLTAVCSKLFMFFTECFKNWLFRIFWPYFKKNNLTGSNLWKYKIHLIIIYHKTYLSPWDIILFLWPSNQFAFDEVKSYQWESTSILECTLCWKTVTC